MSFKCHTRRKKRQNKSSSNNIWKLAGNYYETFVYFTRKYTYSHNVMGLNQDLFKWKLDGKISVEIMEKMAAGNKKERCLGINWDVCCSYQIKLGIL